MKNKILKTITWLAFIAFLFSGSCLDTAGYIPLFICFISVSWLLLFAYANGLFVRADCNE